MLQVPLAPTALLRWLLLITCLMSGAGLARAAGGPALGEALTADGTLRPGVRGSFDATGYTMRTAPDGRPAFQPAARPQWGPGDENWSSDFRITGVNGQVRAMVVDGSGNLYIGGTFSAVGGIVATNVAKWDGSGWMPLGAGIPGDAYALALDASGTLYAGGNFYVGNTGTQPVVRWTGTAWVPLGSGLTGSVNALAIGTGGSIYAGGVFTQAGAGGARGVARWDGTAWNALGMGTDSGVYALAVDASGNLYAGGTFDIISGVPANHVAKWNGTTWSPLGAGTLDPGAYGSGYVKALTVDQAGNLYVGGSFTRAGNVAASHVAKWNGSAWTALGGGAPNYIVYALLADASGAVYLAGSLNSSQSAVVRWNSTSWDVTSNILSGYVQALAPGRAGRVYASGSFTTAGSMVVGSVAQWSPAANSWARLQTAFSSNQGAIGAVYMLAPDGSGGVFAGGERYLSAVGDVPTLEGNARWTGTAWSAAQSFVTATVVNGTGTLYSCGGYRDGNIVRNGVARWNGTAWVLLGSAANSLVTSIVLDASGNLYASGYFTSIGGVAARYVAKWNGTTWVALSNSPNAGVSTLVIDENNTLYGTWSYNNRGDITTNIGKWNGSTWQVIGTIAGGYVYTMAVDGNHNLYAGGDFKNLNGQLAGRIARWDGTAWNMLNGGADGPVNALLPAADSNLYVGGSFTSAGGTTASNLARWSGSWSALGTGTNGRVLALAPAGNRGFYAGGDFSATGDGSQTMSNFGYYSYAPLAAAAQVVTGLEVFPNPARSRATVQVPGQATPATALLTLCNALGQLVRTQQVVLPPGGARAELDLTNLTPGLYQLRVQVGSQQLGRALVVE